MIVSQERGGNMNPEAFRSALQKHQITLNDYQMHQFDTYYHDLIDANQNVNLTAITAQNEVYLKHFYDSLLPAFFVDALRNEPLRLCDVGAGAGFPSLPLKIAFPKLAVTIVDSLNKRINFLQSLVTDLNMTNVELIHRRAEDFGNKKSPARATFDIVTARAVAALPVLAELCLPLVKENGYFIALKASHADVEIKQAQYALQVLGGQLVADHQLLLPNEAGVRHILIIKKNKPTPKKYPRKAGTPNREPLLAKETR